MSMKKCRAFRRGEIGLRIAEFVKPLKTAQGLRNIVVGKVIFKAEYARGLGKATQNFKLPSLYVNFAKVWHAEMGDSQIESKHGNVINLCG